MLVLTFSEAALGQTYDRVKLPKITTVTSDNKQSVYIGMAYQDMNNTINPVKARFGTRSVEDPSYEELHESVIFKRDYNGYINTDTNLDEISGYIRVNGTYYWIEYAFEYQGTYLYKTDYTGNLGRNGKGSAIYKAVGGGTLNGGITGSTSGKTEQSNDPTVTDSSAAGYHIIASDNTTIRGGQYASVGIVPAAKAGTTKNVGVVAWYDASARRVAYSYNTDLDNPVAGGMWQEKANYLDEQYTGWHVDLTVDDNGGIHIAYYNSAKGDLKYVYLSKYNAEPSNPVTVDSYLSVGTNITINTRHEGENYVPYIYYYNASSNQTPNSIKVAWRTDMTSLRDGARPDKTDGGAKDTFTGAWESMTIPTENIPVEATVCGGVPSTATGTNVYMNSTVFLGYMSDTGYEKAYIKK